MSSTRHPSNILAILSKFLTSSFQFNFQIVNAQFSLILKDIKQTPSSWLRRQRTRQKLANLKSQKKETMISAHAACPTRFSFWLISLTSPYETTTCLKWPNLRFCGGRQHTTLIFFFSFSKFLIRSFQFNAETGSSHFKFEITWNNSFSVTKE